MLHDSQVRIDNPPLTASVQHGLICKTKGKAFAIPQLCYEYTTELIKKQYKKIFGCNKFKPNAEGMSMKNRGKFRLADIREERKYTRTRFASELGMSARTIEEIEKRGSATKENLQKIANFLKLESIDDLYEAVEEVEHDSSLSDHVDFCAKAYKSALENKINLSDNDSQERYLSFMMRSKAHYNLGTD